MRVARPGEGGRHEVWMQSHAQTNATPPQRWTASRPALEGRGHGPQTVGMKFLGVEGLGQVSRVGLGTWQFGSREWGYGETYASGTAREIVHRARELGVTGERPGAAR